MDNLDELIAAGESIVEKLKKNGHNQSSQCKELVSRTPTGTPSTNKTIDFMSQEDNSNLSVMKKDAVVCSNISSSTSLKNFVISTYSQSKNEANKQLETLSDDSSSRSQDSSAVESFSYIHIQKLKEECALIFSLGHSMASSLFNANRLLNQMVKNDSTPNSDVEESLLSEISSCDESCKENGVKLEESGSRIHYLLGKLSENYHRSRELESTISGVQNQASELLELTKELLTKNNFNHLIPVIEKQRLSPARLLEEVNLGLTLLSGELPSCLLEEQTLKLNDSRNYQTRLEQRLEALEDEFRNLSEEKSKKVAEVEIQLEKTFKELVEAQEESLQLRKQKETLEECLRKQIADIETKNTSLIYEIVKVKELLQNEKSMMAKESEKHDLVRSKLEEEISSLKQKFRSIDDQKNAQEKNAERVCKNFEDSQSKISNENESFKAKMLKAQLEKQRSMDEVKLLEEDLEKQKYLNECLLEDISGLREDAQKKATEFVTDLQLMDKKIDYKNEELCEKNSELRSMEVQLMEMKMELELERQRSHTLSAEIDLLTKQECNSRETTSAALEDLKCELNEAKKSVRAAREEARRERIEAARLKQQLAMMQIDLESAREAADRRLECHSLDKSRVRHSSRSSAHDMDPMH